jgi:hypothetical protein
VPEEFFCKAAMRQGSVAVFGFWASGVGGAGALARGAETVAFVSDSALAGSGMKRVDHECFPRPATDLSRTPVSFHFFRATLYGGRAVFIERMAFSRNSVPFLEEDKFSKVFKIGYEPQIVAAGDDCVAEL